MSIIVDKISHVYEAGTGFERKALDNVSFAIEDGEFIGLIGHTGSGKSTLLNCIGGLDTVDSGSIVVDGMEVAGLGSKALSDYRRNKLGFIFQFYNLVPNLTVKENIQVCQYLTKNPLDLEELLQVLGLTEHQNKFPAQLSGGQQQRCAIARALINEPKILLADEPTGNLDSNNAWEIMKLLDEINKRGTTVLVVSHNMEIVEAMKKRVITLQQGHVVSDVKMGGDEDEN